MTIDYLEQFGKRLLDWQGQVMGNRLTHFFIYQRDEQYWGIGFIGLSYISQPFDHLPSPQEVEEHFENDERFKQHFRT